MLMCLRAGAQTAGRYQALDSLLHQGLYRSAAVQAAALYRQCREDTSQEPETLLALQDWLSAEGHLGEDPLRSGLRLSDSLRRSSTGVLEAWLWVVRASYMERLLNQHRFELPETDNPYSPNPLSWSAFQLQDSITASYLRALGPSLKTASSQRYQGVLDPPDAYLSAEPVLFDVVAERALAYWAAVPSRPFRQPQAPDWEALFVPAAALEGLPLNAAMDPPWISLRLYQQLLRLHHANPSSEALVHADLNRLAFVYRHAGGSSGDSLYLHALQHLDSTLKGSSSQAEVRYALAALYQDWGQRYQPFSDTATRWDLRRALELSRDAIEHHPTSPGSRHCQELLVQLLARSLDLKAEQVNLPDRPLRLLLGYRNLSGVRLTLYRMNPDRWPQDIQRGAAADSPALKALRSWTVSLSNPGDLQEHHLELPLRALRPGLYAVEAASLYPRDSLPAVQANVEFWVSNLALLQGPGVAVTILDRRRGTPVAACPVEVFQRLTEAGDSLRLTHQFRTDAQGLLDLDSLGLQGQVYVQVRKGADRMWRSVYLPYGSPQPVASNSRLLLYSDRALYQPGQALQLAGLRFQRADSAGAYRVSPGASTLLYLERPDGQLADSLRCISGPDGSFEARFELPDDALTGTWSIRSVDPAAFCSVQVEAFRPPQVDLDLHPDSGAWVLGDRITVAGRVRMTSGLPLQHARLRYAVYRSAPGPVFRLTRPIRFPETILEEDSLQSDGQGRFTLSFAAQAAEGDQTQATFRVEVQLEAPDGSMVQRSCSLSVGRQPFGLRLQVPSHESLDRFRSLRLALVGNPPPEGETLQVEASWQALTPPPHWMRARYWSRPDMHLLDSQTFHHLFPWDPYAAEDDPGQWPGLDTALHITLQWHIGSPIAVPEAWRKAGWYRLHLDVQDARGHRWQEAAVVELYDVHGTDPERMPPLDARLDTLSYAGTVHDILRLRAAQGGMIWIRSRRVSGSARTFQAWGSNRQQVLDLGAASGNGAGRSVQIMRIWQNRIYRQQLDAPRSWVSKHLQLQLLQRPGTAEPGDTASWVLQVRGPQGQPVQASLTVVLYDAAEDALAPLVWNDPRLYPTSVDVSGWSDPEGFAAAYGTSGYYQRPLKPASGLEPPQLRLDFLPPEVARIFTFSDRVASAKTVLSPKESSTARAQDPFRRLDEVTPLFRVSVNSDSRGLVHLKVPLPGALTRWRLLVLAHTPDMAYGFGQDSLLTRKPLMLVADVPQACVAGDTIQAGVRVFNASSHSRMVQVQVSWYLPGSDMPMWTRKDSLWVDAGGSAAVEDLLPLASGHAGWLRYRMQARSGRDMDALEGDVPVRRDWASSYQTQSLVTEGIGSWRLTPPPAGRLRPQALMVGWSANPAFEALNALPLLVETPDPDALSWAAKLYSACLGLSVLHEHPELAALWQQYRTRDLLEGGSPLHQIGPSGVNRLDQTPWMGDAEADARQRAALGQLFQEDTLRSWLSRSFRALAQLQRPDGSLAWLPQGSPDFGSTTQVLTELQQALRLPGLDSSLYSRLRNLSRPLLQVTDSWIYRRVREDTGQESLSLLLHPLYAASAAWSWAGADSLDSYRGRLLRLLHARWNSLRPSEQASSALVMQRLGDTAAAQAVMASLRETALSEGGLHWKELRTWTSEDPVGDQSRMLEAFEDLGGSTAELRSMQRWLLGQKQGVRWQGTLDNLQAIQGLLVQQSDWFSRLPRLYLQLQDTTLVLNPGSGPDPSGRLLLSDSLWNRSWRGPIHLLVRGAAPGAPCWVNASWIYRAPLKDLAATGQVLRIRRILTAGSGGSASSVQAAQRGTALNIQLEIQSTQDLDYVRLTDQPGSLIGLPYRASGWRYDHGLAYYQAREGTRMLVYIRHLPKGTHVLSFPAYLERRGAGISGWAELQSLYAPMMEANSQVEWLRVP